MTGSRAQEAALRSGLSEPTLRYHEDVGLVGPIPRDPSSGHRRYGHGDIDDLQVLACLRAMGVGMADMRAYQANRLVGRARAGGQRDLLLRQAQRIEGEIETLHVHLDYLRARAALWEAREGGDPETEAMASARVQAMLPGREETLPR